jgi:Arc/MetJ family transcription regulator
MGERLTIELDDATTATVRRAGVSHEQLEAVAVQAIRRLVIRDAVAALERWHQAHPDYAQLADHEYDDALAELA